jgi:ketosteroid isomerase-like protein
MARKLSEQELLDLETEYWQAIRDKDADAAIRLSDQPCIITGAQGIRRIEGETLRNLIKTTLYTLHDVRLSDVQVHALEDDVAIVAYNVHEELTVEGKPVSLDATDTSTWVRRDGRWLCAVHTSLLKEIRLVGTEHEGRC